MQGEKVVMGFDPGALTRLMGVLSEIYSDPTGAVAREYITNALDSHIREGQTRPVEVSLPSGWRGNLVVQDFGIGMDIEDIRNTYSKYGASTKLDNDLEAGMLGIGSKSAFAYSNSFTVVGVKNGRRVTVSVMRDEDGEGVMTILDDSDTDERNGVTITVPVSNASAMNERVREFCKFLPEGLVHVDGVDLSERAKWVKIASDVENEDGDVVILNIWSVPIGNHQNARAMSRIIMGNVPYETIRDFTSEHNIGFTVYAEVVMGAVAFAPSREKLMDVRRTRLVEELIGKTYKARVGDSIRDWVLEADTRAEALKRYSKRCRTLRNLGITNVVWNGEEIPTPDKVVWTAPDGVDHIGRVYQPNRSRNAIYTNRMLDYDDFLSDSTLIVLNTPDKTITTTIKKKATQYINNNGMNHYSWGSPGRRVMQIHFINDGYQVTDPWLLDAETVDYADIAAEVLPRNNSVSTYTGVKTKGMYHVYDGTAVRDLRALKDTETVFAVAGSNMRVNGNLCKFIGTSPKMDDYDYNKVLSELQKALGTDVTIVDVYLNRLEKFKRDWPTATYLTPEDAYARLVDKARASISDDDIKGWAYWHDIYGVGGLDRCWHLIPDDDPDKESVREYPDYESRYSRVEQVLRIIPNDAEIKAKCDKFRSEYKEVAARIKHRYLLMGVSMYYDNRLTDEVLRRYYQSDLDFYNSQEG
jgi:hypothetical protein